MRETEILVEQQPPQGVLVCENAGLVINEFSLSGGPRSAAVHEMARCADLVSGIENIRKGVTGSLSSGRPIRADNFDTLSAQVR